MPVFLFNLPQDIFRVIFQYLSLDELMRGEEAFLNNQELLSHYQSSLEGFTLKEKITMKDEEDEIIISWIINRKLLVETLVLHNLRDLEMDLLNQSRSSIKSIEFNSPPPDSVIPQLIHFPSLTLVTFWSSKDFTNDQLLSFFCHTPQLEIVEMYYLPKLSNEILTHLSDYCPNIKILSLPYNDWVNDETMSLLTQQGLFPNLKSLEIRETRVRNQESLRQFILSHPLLSGLLLPQKIHYSTDFLVFYLRQVIFPSILSLNNNSNDLESHSLAIVSLSDTLRGILNERSDVVNPEIFSVDILSQLYHKDCSNETLCYSTSIFYYLSKSSDMINSILQSQFIPVILDSTNPVECPDFFGDLLINCGVFHDYFPLLVEKYRTHPFSFLGIFHRVVKDHYSLLTPEELQIIIPIVSNNVPNGASPDNFVKLMTKLLRKPSSQHLVDPNALLSSFKSMNYSNYHLNELFDCLKIFISLKTRYQHAFIESNLLPQIMKLVEIKYLIYFTHHCLLISRDGLLVGHLADSGLFQYLLSIYSHSSIKNQIESLFKVLIEFKNNKYSEIVKGMELPNALRSKLFERKEQGEN